MSARVCDTVVATARHTADGSVLFAKNSDREPDEPQALSIHACEDHAPDSRVRCTYLTIPEARRTEAVLLSRPTWMWGAEMGANAHGLAVGNEAVFTRAPAAAVGLTGMDLVRLVLERARSAAGGVAVLTALLEEHGQGGACGYRDKRFRYDNSFLLADPADAWVVETAGRVWVAERVDGVRAISNGLTIRERYDRACDGLAARARDLGLHRGKGTVDFAACFGRPALTLAAAARARRACLEAALRRQPAGTLAAMAALRQHGDQPAGSGLRATVCAHAAWLPTRRAAQTTASLVSRLAEDGATHFVTGTSAPCTSVFKPAWIDAGLTGYGPVPGERYDESSWWQHERLHRRALAALPDFVTAFAPERDALEQRLVAAASTSASAAGRARLTERAFAEASELEHAWLARLAHRPPLAGVRASYWRALDRRSGVPG